MSKMGHVLAIPEQAIVICNGYMIHIMKPLDVSSMLKPKKIQSPMSNVQFGTFWTQIEQTSHCDWVKTIFFIFYTELKICYYHHILIRSLNQISS